MTTATTEVTATKGKNGKGGKDETPAVPPVVKMPTLIAGQKGQLEVVFVPLKDLIIDQKQNSRSEPIDLDAPDPEFVALALNIREKGLLNPVTVERIAGGKFSVIAGFHRAMAHMPFSAELDESANVHAKGSENLRDVVVIGEGGKFKFEAIDPVPCVVKVVGSGYDRIVLRGIENIQRNDLTGFETARLVWQAQDEAVAAKLDKSVAQIGRDLGISRPHASNLKETRNLIPKWMKVFEDGGIKLSEAFKFGRMSKEEQKVAFEEWSLKKGGGGENAGEEGEGQKAEPKMLRKDKLEELVSEVDVALKMRIGGKWVEMTTEMIAVCKAFGKFVLKPSKTKPLFQVPVEEVEEEDEEGED